MFGWDWYGRLLRIATETAATKFLGDSPNYEIAAFGYTFELANMSPAFSLVLNSPAFFAKTREEYRKHTPSVSEDDLRWSSGDFEYCALRMSGIVQPVEWEVDYVSLHEHSCRGSDSFSEVYDGLVRISCETLAELACRDFFGDWQRIDFIVAEYSDDKETIKSRHQRIVEIITASSR